MMQHDAVKVLLNTALESALDYRQRIDSAPQRPEHNYRSSLEQFSASTPEEGLTEGAVLEELVRLATPGLHAHTGPRFFGWVIGGSHPVGVAADWLVSAWGQNAGNHVVAPSASAVEAVVTDWLLDILDLPRGGAVGIVTGATMAHVACLAAARNQVLRDVGWDVEDDGLFGAPPVQVIVGADAHVTVYSALQYLGFGSKRVITVETDEQGAVRPADFERAIRHASGPIIAVLQAGQINTGAFDPFADLVPMARARGAWVHVDGAFGLWARTCQEKRVLTEGVEQAHSWATDGHKWLQTPFDCGYAIVREPEALRRAMTVSASYLPLAAEGERDPSQYVPELSRRARGFVTWAMLKHLGRRGIDELVARNCAQARRFAELLSAEPGIMVCNDVVLNQVIVAFGNDDSATRQTMARVQADGECFAAGAMWRGRQVMRLSVTSAATRDSDVERSAAAMVSAWRRTQSDL